MKELTPRQMESTPLAKGRIVASAPGGHELAAQDSVSVHDLMRFPFIGADPDDPYGEILARPFRDAGSAPHHTMRGRQLSSFAKFAIEHFRQELTTATARAQWDPPARKQHQVNVVK